MGTGRVKTFHHLKTQISFAPSIGKFDVIRHSVAASTGFLILNTLAGSGLGFLFWALATRKFSPEQVGLGAAFISTITLIASLGEVGLGTTLIRFLPTTENKQSFVNVSLTIVTGSTLVIGAAFMLTTRFWFTEFVALTQFPAVGVIFIGTLLSFSLAQFLDRLYVAFQVNHLMLIRTICANLLRILTVLLIPQKAGASGFLVAVGIGAIVTLALSATILTRRIMPGYIPQLTFQWSILKSKVRYSLGNHFSQLLWNAPPLIYPLMIIQVLSPQSNASFYVCWMVANVVLIVPTALTTALFARAAHQEVPNMSLLWRSMHLTILGTIPVSIGLSTLAGLFLSLFGASYVSEGRTLLVLLFLSVIPFTYNTFIITGFRIRQDTQGVVWMSSVVTIISFVMSTLLSVRYALTGVGLGWLIGQCTGVAFSFLFCQLYRSDRNVQNVQPY